MSSKNLNILLFIFLSVFQKTVCAQRFETDNREIKKINSDPNLEFYKFKHIKVFGSVENFENNEKFYRKFFDISESAYIYAEVAIFNKYFDQNNWTADYKLICRNINTDSVVGEFSKTFKILDTDNIFYFREGWGTASPGWWKKGDYLWEAYINDRLVAKDSFYIRDLGIADKEKNPYFKINGIKLFESGISGLPENQRVYLKKFSISNLRYVNIEMEISPIIDNDKIPLDFYFYIYNDKEVLKSKLSYFELKNKGNLPFKFDTGYGSETSGFWVKGDYRIDVYYMGNRIAIVPFSIEEQEVISSAKLKYFKNIRDYHSRSKK